MYRRAGAWVAGGAWHMAAGAPIAEGRSAALGGGDAAVADVDVGRLNSGSGQQQSLAGTWLRVRYRAKAVAQAITVAGCSCHKSAKFTKTFSALTPSFYFD